MHVAVGGVVTAASDEQTVEDLNPPVEQRIESLDAADEQRVEAIDTASAMQQIGHGTEDPDSKGARTAGKVVVGVFAVIFSVAAMAASLMFLETPLPGEGGEEGGFSLSDRIRGVVRGSERRHVGRTDPTPDGLATS
jgi:hypothetical protein